MLARTLVPILLSPWTPARLPGLAPSLSVALQRQRGLLWQNATKTTPALIATDPVRVATCPWTGVDYTAPSDAARPLLYDEGSGKWSLSFDGVDDGLYVATSPTDFSGATTFAFRVAQTSADGGGVTRIIRGQTVNALFSGRRTSNGFFIGSTVKNIPGVADAAYHTITVQRATAGNWRLRIDSADQTGLTANSTAWGAVAVGACSSAPSAGETFIGRLPGLVCYTADVTGSSLTFLESYLGGI